MNGNCKICLNKIADNEAVVRAGYHSKCLKKLFGTTNIQTELDLNEADTLREVVTKYADRMSISGVQQKASMRIEGGQLKLTDLEGTYILKLTPAELPEAPANEHVSMEIGRALDIETAECGLVRLKGNSFAYIVKRFDREGELKIHQEDLAQIMGRSRDDRNEYKYNSNYEEVGRKILEVAGNRQIVAVRFIEQLIHRFLIADEDFHLKNISLQQSQAAPSYDKLTPIYDAVNTVMYLKNELGYFGLAGGMFVDRPFGERGMVLGFPCADDFIELARKVGLEARPIEVFLDKLKSRKDKIFDLIENSFLSKDRKIKYRESLTERYTMLFS